MIAAKKKRKTYLSRWLQPRRRPEPPRQHKEPRDGNREGPFGEVLEVTCRVVLALLEELVDNRCARTHLVSASSSETFTRSPLSRFRCGRPDGHTRERRIGASIENWHVPEIALAPCSQKPRRISPISWWKRRLGISFQVFASQGKSDSDEWNVREDEHVDVVDMGAKNRHWARRNSHAVARHGLENPGRSGTLEEKEWREGRPWRGPVTGLHPTWSSSREFGCRSAL